MTNIEKIAWKNFELNAMKSSARSRQRFIKYYEDYRSMFIKESRQTNSRDANKFSAYVYGTKVGEYLTVRQARIAAIAYCLKHGRYIGYAVVHTATDITLIDR